MWVKRELKVQAVTYRNVINGKKKNNSNDNNNNKNTSRRLHPHQKHAWPDPIIFYTTSTTHSRD
jgi:hypothetical protein